MLLTPIQVAERLQVKERTVSDWLKAGQLKGIKVGRLWRVPEENLLEFLDPKPKANSRPLREYTKQQIEEFLKDDVLDPETARKAERILSS